MQKRLIIFMLFSASMSFGQVETNTMNNSQEIPSTPVEEVEEEAEMMDSTRVEPKREGAKGYRSKNIESKAKVSKKSSKELDRVMSADEAPSQKDAEAQSVQSASYGFQYSKNQAGTQREQRSPTSFQQQQMDDAVDFFEVNAPNTFEYHYYKYLAGNYNVELVDHLNEAEKLRPENTDVHVQQAGYNMIIDNQNKGLEYVEKLIDSKRLTESVLLYGEDLLLSAPEGGVLITHGFDDSYSSWYLQKKENIREDVRLISLDFLQSEEYRKELTAEGFKMPNSETIDVDYLKNFCSLNKDKNIGISLTTPKEYFEPIKDNLYVAGLVFEYHEEEYNNHFRNEYLWNSELQKHLITNAVDQKSKQLSANYLPMLLQLHTVYKQNEETEKLREVDLNMDKVGVQCKKYEQVQKLKKAY